MKVTVTGKKIKHVFNRSGGTLISGRLDYWQATDKDWSLAHSLVFQKVTKSTEEQSLEPAPGEYVVVFTARVEESITGKYDFEMLIGGAQVAKENGNVDITSDSHDSKILKNKFVVALQG